MQKLNFTLISFKDIQLHTFTANQKMNCECHAWCLRPQATFFFLSQVLIILKIIIASYEKQ